jgi:uncharacterized protein
MSKDNVAIVNALLDALEAGNLDRMVANCAPDMTVLEPENLPYGGPHVGPVAFRELLETIFKLANVVLKSREVRAAGDRVMVNMFADFTSRITNRTVSTSMVELYSFKEGRITQIDVYYKDVTKLSVLYAER